MTVPPEVLDKILERIPTDRNGRPTLIACALVATRWTGPSQRRLFSSVKIDDDNYSRWTNGVALSGSKTHLLQHVRSLQYQRMLDSGIPYPMQDLPKEPGEFFSALHNIRSLEFVNVRIGRLSKELETCFSAFRGTLTNLTLDPFITSFGAFVSLVDYFPNVTALRLGMFALGPDEGPVPTLSRPLRGKLRILPPHPTSLEFIDRLAKLDQEYEELVVDPNFMPLRTESFERVLQFSTGTVRYLRLLGDLECEYFLHTPSSLHVLIQHFKSWTDRQSRSVIFDNSENCN